MDSHTNRWHVIPLSEASRRNRGNPKSRPWWAGGATVYYLTRDAKDPDCAACQAGDCVQRVEVYPHGELVVHDEGKEMS